MERREIQPPLFAELSGPIPPRDWPEFDENIETDHECAGCGYRWSGGDAADPDELGDTDAKECPRCGAEWTPPAEGDVLTMNMFEEKPPCAG